MEFKRIYEELNVLLPFSLDVKVQQPQQEQMAVMSFLTSLSPEYETTKFQILSSFQISSLHDAFTRVLRTESSQSIHSTCSAFVGHNIIGRQSNKGNKGGNNGNKGESRGVIYYYY
ncbi:hypothetical protein NMG60_11017345 [Bertholletia excelsa]